MQKLSGGMYSFFTSIICVSILTVLPMPDFLVYWRPIWIPLTYLFWQVNFPMNFGPFGAWLLGIYTDVLTGTIFGQNSIALLVMSMVGFQFHRRLLVYPLWQQIILVFCIMAIFQLIIVWINIVEGYSQSLFAYLIPVFTSALFWPCHSVLLDFFCVNQQLSKNK